MIPKEDSLDALERRVTMMSQPEFEDFLREREETRRYREMWNTFWLWTPTIIFSIVFGLWI